MNTPKFHEGQIVRHVKTGTKYRIVVASYRLFTEADGQRAYAYRKEGLHPGPIWVRSKTEMEDGRFEVVE